MRYYILGSHDQIRPFSRGEVSRNATAFISQRFSRWYVFIRRRFRWVWCWGAYMAAGSPSSAYDARRLFSSAPLANITFSSSSPAITPPRRTRRTRALKSQIRQPYYELPFHDGDRPWGDSPATTFWEGPPRLGWWLWFCDAHYYYWCWLGAEFRHAHPARCFSLYVDVVIYLSWYYLSPPLHAAVTSTRRHFTSGHYHTAYIVSRGLFSPARLRFHRGAYDKYSISSFWYDSYFHFLIRNDFSAIYLLWWLLPVFISYMLSHTPPLLHTAPLRCAIPFCAFLRHSMGDGVFFYSFMLGGMSATLYALFFIFHAAAYRTYFSRLK